MTLHRVNTEYGTLKNTKGAMIGRMACVADPWQHHSLRPVTYQWAEVTCKRCLRLAPKKYKGATYAERSIGEGGMMATKERLDLAKRQRRKGFLEAKRQVLANVKGWVRHYQFLQERSRDGETDAMFRKFAAEEILRSLESALR